jgi:hypothetical protein
MYPFCTGTKPKKKHDRYCHVLSYYHSLILKFITIITIIPPCVSDFINWAAKHYWSWTSKTMNGGWDCSYWVLNFALNPIVLIIQFGSNLILYLIYLFLYRVPYSTFQGVAIWTLKPRAQRDLILEGGTTIHTFLALTKYGNLKNKRLLNL